MQGKLTIFMMISKINALLISFKGGAANVLSTVDGYRKVFLV
jgi:hypothetical protein